MHLSGSILNVISALQTSAGHFLLRMCSSYSSLKYLNVVSTGLGAVWPSPAQGCVFDSGGKVFKPFNVLLSAFA